MLVHPVVLAALAVLVVNDHGAKAAFPGPVTGKASDAAGAVVLTALLCSAPACSGLFRRPCRSDGPGPSTRGGRPVRPAEALAVATAVVGLVALVKATGPGNAVGAWAAGLARWPIDDLGALVGGNAPPGIGPAAMVADPTDVLAATAAFAVPVLVWLEASRSTTTVRPSRWTNRPERERLPSTFR